MAIIVRSEISTMAIIVRSEISTMAIIVRSEVATMAIIVRSLNFHVYSIHGFHDDFAKQEFFCEHHNFRVLYVTKMLQDYIFLLLATIG